MSAGPRVAVRVLLLDGQSRVLLFEGRDLSDDSDTYRWWFTAGGGVEEGESLAAAAHRELAEETGVRDLQLIDMDYRREFATTLHGLPLHQVEHFFAARTDPAQLVTEGWTDLERQTVTAWRWWAAHELEAGDAPYFPENLPDLVRRANDLV